MVKTRGEHRVTVSLITHAHFTIRNQASSSHSPGSQVPTIPILNPSNEFSHEINSLLVSSSFPAVRNLVCPDKANIGRESVRHFIDDWTANLCNGRPGDLTALRCAT
jgi:hypothetical protein